MRLRLGLAALFAIVAVVPLTLAVQWYRGASAAILRDAQAERVDRLADVLESGIERDLARSEAEARRLCADATLGTEPVRARGAVYRAIAAAELDGWAHDGRGSLLRDVSCDARAVRASVSLSELAPGSERGDVRLVVLEGGEGDAPEGTDDRRVLRTFPGRERAPAARIALDVAQAPLAVREREQTELRLEIAAIASVVIALLLGWIVGGRVQRSLAELEQAAQRIGKGDLEVRFAAPRGSASATFSAFNRMAHELREAQSRAKRAERVAAWRDIARRIAHEIKNPLTPIRMSIETMRRTKQRQHPDFDEIFDESTRTVLEEVERLERIVTEFSRFARLPRPSPSLLDVRDVVSQVVQLHSPGGDATITDTSPRMPIKMVLASDLPKVRADRDQLTQVLVNLVQNAIDAARSKQGDQGHVEIEVAATPEGLVRVTVSDDGPGIPEEERGRVLEPYYTTKAGGTGLGLSIVDRIVSEHGGSLSVGESRAGGAALSFTLTREGPVDDAEASQSR